MLELALEQRRNDPVQAGANENSQLTLNQVQMLVDTTESLRKDLDEMRNTVKQFTQGRRAAIQATAHKQARIEATAKQ